MSPRARTAAISVGILAACLLLALILQVLGADRQEVRRFVSVTAVSELDDGRLLVREAPAPASVERIPVTAITRYPFGVAVLEPGGDGKPLDEGGRAVAVRTATLAPGPVRRTVVAFGTAEAARDAEVAAETGGRVAEVAVRLGGRVAAGAALVALDDRDRRLALQRAEAQRARAEAACAGLRHELETLEQLAALAAETVATRERDRARWAELAQRNVSSRAQADQADVAWRAARSQHHELSGRQVAARDALVEAEATLDLARAERELAALELERCTVRAPFAGEVAERRVDVGDLLAAGRPVVRLVAQETIRLRVHVREGEAAALAPGSAAAISFPGLDVGGAPAAAYPGTTAARPGRVVGVSAAADPRSRKVAVDIELANADGLLRAGVFARADLDAGVVEGVYLVPSRAIVATETEHVVYVVEGATARAQPVALGPRQGEDRIVTGGLTGEVEVVVEGTGLLFDGAPVARLDAPAAGK